MLIEPVAPPEPEPDWTPQMEQQAAFHEASREGPGFASGLEPVAVTASEVCVYGGWPRRHTVVGRNCPHGMLDEEDEIVDYT
jgi:hypothetical protein